MVCRFTEHNSSSFSAYMLGAIRTNMTLCAITILKPGYDSFARMNAHTCVWVQMPVKRTVSTLTHVHVFTCIHVHTYIEHSTHTLRLERPLATSGACVYERPLMFMACSRERLLVFMSYSRKCPLVFSVFFCTCPLVFSVFFS